MEAEAPRDSGDLTRRDRRADPAEGKPALAENPTVLRDVCAPPLRSNKPNLFNHECLPGDLWLKVH